MPMRSGMRKMSPHAVVGGGVFWQPGGLDAPTMRHAAYPEERGPRRTEIAARPLAAIQGRGVAAHHDPISPLQLGLPRTHVRPRARSASPAKAAIRARLATGSGRSYN